MENRSRGEETYVIINTTGEPLSPTENIKPILLGNSKLTKEQVQLYSDQWEDREEWFWNHRGTDTTSDNGMQVFFMWYWQIGLMQERAWVNEKPVPLNPRNLFISAPTKMKESTKEVKLSMENYEKFRSLDNIEKYFKALTRLVEKISSDVELQTILHSIYRRQNKDIALDNQENVWQWLRNADLDIVLPLIALLAEHPNTKQLTAFTRRIRRNYFDGLWAKDENNVATRRGQNKMDWRYLIQIINQVDDKDLLNIENEKITFSKIPLIDIPIWYDKNEQIKDKLREEHPEAIDLWEDNEYLMGDLTPLWNDCNKEDIDFETLKERFLKIDKLCRMLNESQVKKEEYQFSNWYRLYRVISGLVQIGHIQRTKWEYEGCYFSYKEGTPWWLEKSQIMELISSDDQIEYMKNYIRHEVSKFIRAPHDHIELIKSWLTLKVLKADSCKEGVYLLNYYDDRAVSAYIDIQSNYIIPYESFNWGNILLGYSYSYTIYPARDIWNWQQVANLDSPLFDIPYIGYDNEEHHIENDDIKKAHDYINVLIDSFLNNNAIVKREKR